MVTQNNRNDAMVALFQDNTFGDFRMADAKACLQC